jgi:hypothetical protein
LITPRPPAQTVVEANILREAGQPNAIRTRQLMRNCLKHRAPRRVGRPQSQYSALRSVPPAGSGGPVETPILSEQGHKYIVRQLQLYASGERRNDVYARMRAIAARLTPTEVERLATYYRAGFK